MDWHTNNSNHPGIQMSLDKGSPLPRHLQLREAIRRDALRNGLCKGDPIPSERELGHKYQVSRVTVRRAIGDLVAEGFLRRKGRKGTFVDDVSRGRNWTSQRDGRLIGLLISRVQTSFSDLLLHGIDEYCHDLGYSVVFAATDEDHSRAARQLDRMMSEGVVGFIFVPVAGDDYEEVNATLMDRVRAESVPFVLMDRYLGSVKADTVVSDNFDGAYRATKHLVDLGHKHIAFVGYLECSAVNDRILGYRKCLMDNGISPDESLIVNPRPEDVKDTVAEMLRAKPDISSIFAVNDAKAMLVWEALTEIGLEVPRDIALVGYDNLYGSSSPGALLSTTEQPLEAEGRLACQMLLERADGLDVEPRFAVLKSHFVVGQSTIGKEVVRKPIAPVPMDSPAETAAYSEPPQDSASLAN